MKSLGQMAYEEDVELDPLYADGTPRKRWNQLCDIARDSWERKPTVRAYHKTASKVAKSS